MAGKKPTVADLAKRIEAQDAEIAALRAVATAGSAAGGMQAAPTATRQVVFTGLAVRRVPDDRDVPIAEIVGKPGETKSLRIDIAEAWMRRKKAVPAESEEAAKFLANKRAVADALEAAEGEISDIEAAETERESKRKRIARAAQKRREALKG